MTVPLNCACCRQAGKAKHGAWAADVAQVTSMQPGLKLLPYCACYFRAHPYCSPEIQYMHPAPVIQTAACSGLRLPWPSREPRHSARCRRCGSRGCEVSCISGCYDACQTCRRRRSSVRCGSLQRFGCDTSVFWRFILYQGTQNQQISK